MRIEAVRGIPPLALGFAALLVVLAALWLWRHRKERPLNMDTLWRFPAMMTALILPLVYLQPHKPFRMLDYGIFGMMIALGMATGTIRARATTLRMDHPSRQIMIGISGWALLMLLPIGAMRQFAREHLGMWIEALRHSDVRALIGSMLFALAMILSHRTALYWRAKRFLRRYEMSDPPASS